MATPMRVVHTCQTHLEWLFVGGFTPYYDLNDAWEYAKGIWPGTTVITEKTLVFCSDQDTYEMGIKGGAQYFLSLVPVQCAADSVCFPMHMDLWYVQPKLAALKTMSMSFYEFPGLQERHLCFNASKLANTILIRVSKEKWGESATIAVKADDLTQALVLNGGAPGSTVYEDPRLFSWRGDICSAFTVIENYTVGVHTKQGLGYCSVFPVMEGILMPKYGKNLLQGPEKNWGFFEEGGELYALYSYRPWKILRIRREEVEEVYTEEFPAPYKGRIHGGTCPKLVDGLWWAFGRVIDETGCPSIIVVAFEPKTFRIVGYAEPSFLTREALGMNLFYIGSAEWAQEGSWDCVGGWNDTKVFRATIPHAAILREMRWGWGFALPPCPPAKMKSGK